MPREILKPHLLVKEGMLTETVYEIKALYFQRNIVLERVCARTASPEILLDGTLKKHKRPGTFFMTVWVFTGIGANDRFELSLVYASIVMA